MYNVYIDESGDEGFNFKADNIGGSSKWFVLAAVIVHQSFDKTIASCINEIKDILKFQPAQVHKPLHFKDLSHEKKVVTLNCITSKGNFEIVAVAGHKIDLHKDCLLPYEKQYLYNYTCKLLLERISWNIHEKKGKANLIFEHRRNTSYTDLKLYIDKVMDSSRCQIRKDIFVDLKALPKTQKKNLQIADCIAHSVWKSLEPNQYDGDIEDKYIRKLAPLFYRKENVLHNYGLKIYPDSNVINQEKYNWFKIL